ncbi:MAG: NAD(P)/FAD-dependent oxidoreductase [Arenicella sp.]
MATLDNLPSKEVTIIGSGIIGICCALSLLKRGITVRLIEKSSIEEAASFGNAGVVSPWSCIPQSVPGIWKKVPGMLLDADGPLNIHPLHALKFLPWGIRFLRAGNSLEKVEKTSIAMNALSAPSIDLYQQYLNGTRFGHLLKESWAIHAHRHSDAVSLSDLGVKFRLNLGAEIEIATEQELQQLEPALSRDFKAALLIKEQARTVNPGMLVEVLSKKAKELGADFQSASVQRVTPTDDQHWLLHTDTGTLSCEKVVIAAGANSMNLLQPLGFHLPLERERGYHVEFNNPQVTLQHSVMDAEFKFISSSMEGGLRSAGTAEFSGAKVKPNFKRASLLKKLTKKMLPDLQEDQSTQWMGVRPSFPDSLPCLCELPQHQGLFTAFGHSHYGLSMAPGTGEVLADLITNTVPAMNLNPYHPDRFR